MWILGEQLMLLENKPDSEQDHEKVLEVRAKVDEVLSEKKSRNARKAR